MDSQTTLPRTSLTLDDARRTLSGLHFAKEALSKHEREILYVAEGLLRLIDSLPDSADLPEVQNLIRKPGVHEVCVYPDGIEVVGSPDDSDTRVGFVLGAYDPAHVRAVVGPDLSVSDMR